MVEVSISLEKFWQLRQEIPLVDARSPGEYAHSHIPEAINLPILNDEERVHVGTLYKNSGALAATLKGFELVGPRFHEIQKSALTQFPDRKVILYCWRGGMRSQILSWLLSQVGFQVFRLEGGYKSYRKFTFDQVRLSYPYLVLGGKTGTGKTVLLQKLREEGEQVIDLEALAHHKGSSFGAIGQKPQPSVEHFENLLAEQLRLIDSKNPIWIENESQRIGNILLPESMYVQMTQSPRIEIQKTTEERIEHISQEYAQLDAIELMDAVKRIQKRLGGLRTQQAIEDIKNKNHASWIANMLIYYDKAYEFDLQRHDPDKTIVLDLHKKSLSQQVNLLLQVKNNFYGKFYGIAD
jgi:tRNA 2-selenouridine synthase